jgi:alkyl hydroperoxide reductase subunit F
MTESKVVVYSTPTCPFCKKAKEFLTKKEVAFIDHDVTTDKEALEEMRKLTQGGLSVPVLHICDEIIIGFDQARIEKALDECQSS